MQKNTPSFDPYEFTEVKVGNARIFYKHLPWAPCIHLEWSFAAGAFQDPVGKEGTAHFLEHLVAANGSPMVPNRKAMREFSRLYMLKSKNAFTSYYRTYYVGRCLPEHFEKVATTMYDYIFRSFVRPEDVEHERKVITEEAWQRYKNEKYLAYIKEFNSNLYLGHQRSRITSPLGWPETITAITRADLVDFYKTHYVAENLSLFVVGHIDEGCISLLQDLLTQVPTGQAAALTNSEIPNPQIQRFEKTSEEIGDPKKQLEFSIVRATTDFTEKDRDRSNQARQLLHDLLFERLRTEHSLCYGVSIRTILHKNYFEGSIGIETSKENLEKVEMEVWNIINEIISGVWKERFETLHQVAIDYIRSQELISEDIISNASGEYDQKGTISTLKEDIQSVEKVTYEEVADFVRACFQKDKVVTEVIFPKEN